MTGRNGTAAPRLLQAVGVGSTLYGALLVFAPRVAVSAVGAVRRPPTWIVRVLGVRQLGQGAALLVRPVASTAAVSVVVDGLHALTMVAAAVHWPGHRRAAAASGAIAAASAALAASAAGRGRGPWWPGPHRPVR